MEMAVVISSSSQPEPLLIISSNSLKKKSLNIFITNIIQKIDLYSCLQFPPHDQVTGFELQRDQLCESSFYHTAWRVKYLQIQHSKPMQAGIAGSNFSEITKKFNTFKTVTTFIKLSLYIYIEREKKKEEIYRKKEIQKG